MNDRIIRITTLKGDSLILDGTANRIKIVLQTATDTHSFNLSAVRHDAENGHYLEAEGGTKIKISGEDAIKATALINSAPKKKNGALPFILGALGLLFLLIIIGSLSSPSSTPATSNNEAEALAETKPAAPVAMPIGTAATFKNAEVTVIKSLLRHTVGTAYTQENAAEGGVLVVVEYKIKNIGDKPMKSYEQPKLKLVDPSGTEYSPDIGKSSSYAMESELDMKLMSDVNPDIAVKNAEVFEVSATRFDPATWYAVTEDGIKFSLK